MNDLGVLEVITDDLLCNETLNTSSESEKSSKEKAQTIKEEPGSEPVKKGKIHLTHRNEIWSDREIDFR